MTEVSRREVLHAIVFGFAATPFAPLARVAAGTEPPGTNAPLPALSAPQRELVAGLSELIVPTTDTPGAIEAGVPDFISAMFDTWFTDDERLAFQVGLEAFDAACRTTHRAPFSGLDASAQALFFANQYRLGEREKISLQPHFLEALRQIVVAGYYTSKVGMTMERRYIPTPGRYDGHYRYSDVGTLFTY
jgi:hypothetical protein